MIAPSPAGDHRKHDTALRHKIRNLRAKVRLLLPLELCCKEQKRSKNLMKMEHNRQLELSSHHRHRWDFSREGVSQLYVPPPPIPLEKHLFEKLTPAELEQIKEDKLYYVGEEFLEHFDHFLDEREREKEKPSRAGPHKPCTPCTPTLLQPIIEFNHKSSLSMGEQEQLRRENACEQRMRRVVRMEGIQAKRKLITEEDTTRRAYIKIKGRENMERHLQNHSRARKEKQQRIQQRSHANMLRTAQSFNRSRNTLQAAEITQLSEQLRSLCLLRQSNSAKIMCRQ